MSRYCVLLSISVALLAGCARTPLPAQPVRPDAPPVAAAESSPDPVPAAQVTPNVTQPVSGTANAQAASVQEALTTGRHPERLSLLIPPKPFDAVAFARDPEGSLAVIEPGRVFQTARPGPDVPHLEPVGATAARVPPGGSTTLAVRSAPGGPVSWVALDLGSFSNQLNAITVRADADGIARVTFTATPGASHTLRVLAGSPLASGQVRFVVDVLNQGIVPVAEPPAPIVSSPESSQGVQP